MYKAQKPCSFAGQSFRIGDDIPDGLVHETAIPRLVKAGIIAEAGSAGPLLPASASLEATVEMSVLADEGEAFIDVTIGALLEGVRAIQMGEEDLIEEIKTIESGDTLMIIDIIRGGNNAIGEAAKKRAEELGLKDEPEGHPETESELLKLKKDELIRIAELYGYEATEEDTKKTLTAIILETLHQGSGE